VKREETHHASLITPHAPDDVYLNRSQDNVRVARPPLSFWKRGPRGVSFFLLSR